MKSPSTPVIVQSPSAKAPSYSLSGVLNAMNKTKNQNGFLSTFFGRSSGGTAERLSNYIKPDKEPTSFYKNNLTIGSRHGGAALRQNGLGALGATSIPSATGSTIKTLSGVVVKK